MASFFDVLAPLYAKARPRTERTLRLITNAAPFATSDVVVDLGGGAGNIAALLAPTVASITVVDQSPKMIEECRKKHVACVVGAGEDIPMADASVDKVLVVDALHHIPAQTQAIKEMYRVLKPGGVAVLVEYDPTTLGGGAISFMEWVLNLGSTFHTPHALADMFAAEGFTTNIPNPRKAQYVLVATKKLQKENPRGPQWGTRAG